MRTTTDPQWIQYCTGVKIARGARPELAELNLQFNRQERIWPVARASRSDFVTSLYRKKA
jgi:hypothetical protein